MDWYKVKAAHTLHDGMSARTFLAWHKIMALTAHLETMPTEAQILTVCGPKCYSSVVQFFLKCNSSVTQVLTKVLEDAVEVSSKREYNKIKKRQSREKVSNVNVDKSNQSETCTEQEKIREEKIILNTVTPPSAAEVIPLKTAAVKTTNKKGGAQGDFVELWKTLYLQETGQTFVADVADYTIIANLLKTVPVEDINSKALMFFKMCSGSVEPIYGINNMGDFTIKKFKSFYNRILIGG